MSRTPLQLESLENRQLLTADILLGGGVLEIQGTEAADTVEVTESRRGTIYVTVEANGDRIREKFDVNDVDSIRFSGSDGDDRFTNNSTLPSVAYGNDGNDTLIGGTAADEMFGGPGDDRLEGRGGEDILHGDYGNDHLIGGDDNDDLRGWYGDDVIEGGDGDDYLSGYHGDDTMLAGDGDDVLKGHEGNDMMDGGSGDDRIYGWKGDDYMIGGLGDDYLSGWSGNDIMLGGHGNDNLRGHSGSDLLIGGRGSDRMEGGSGEDLNIGSSTWYDARAEALQQILDFWSNDDGTVNERADALYSGQAANTPRLNHYLLINDFAEDVFIDDAAELDWFLYHRGDEIQNA